MEFNFDIGKTIGNISPKGVAFIDGSKPGKYSRNDYQNIYKLLDTIGELSAKVRLYIFIKQAQGLPTIITTGSKFFGSDQHIYLMCKDNIFIGFIKVGYKHLFIYDESSKIHEINPLCVLDFYTYEDCQRKGYGNIIFTEMLKRERIEPRKLGYDRPSNKFINFLRKYFNLYNYIPQTNNFIVFQDYFLDAPKLKDRYDIYSSPKENNNNYDNYYKNEFHNEKIYYDTSKYNKQNNYFDDYNKYKMNNEEISQRENQYESKEKDNMNSNKKYNIYQDTYSASYRNPKEYKEYYSDFNELNNNDKELNNMDNNKVNNNYHYSSYLNSFRIPAISYQYRKTSSEYGSFFNYGK